MNPVQPKGLSLPDALIGWTTAAALLAFGVLFLDDAVIMGRTIFALGVLAIVNEGLKLHAWRAGAGGRYRRIRLALALAYVMLVCIGFLFPPARP